MAACLSLSAGLLFVDEDPILGVDNSKAKGATSILLSMVPYKDWKDGRNIRKEQDTFVKWTANAAKTTGNLFIDTNAIIAEGLERLGPEKVAPLFGDARTHSSPEGAKYNAAAIVAGMKGLTPDPLARYFSKLVDELPLTLILSATGPVKKKKSS